MQITINAFATLDDIAEWLTPFAEKSPLHFVLVVHFPKRFVPLARWHFVLVVHFPKRFVPLARWEQFVAKARATKATELWLDLVPIPTARGKLDPKYNNRERFIVHLPEITESGLREGNFGTVATKEKHLITWRSIVRAVRKNTTGGMWIWNGLHKTKGFSDRSRYSPRIAELHAQGLRLRPFVGDNDVFVREPTSDGEPAAG